MPVIKNSEDRSQKSGTLRRKIKAWVATDKQKLNSGGRCTCLFFGEKPVLKKNGFFDNAGRRHPLPDEFKQSPGRVSAVTVVFEKGKTA